MFKPSSREIPIEKQAATLLFIDVQNYNARRDGGEYVGMSTTELSERFGYFFDIIERETISNMQKIQTACRAGQVEVMYTVIESLTKDGRDRTGRQRP